MVKTMFWGTQQAFSLLELLVALCVFIMLVALSIPAFTNLIMDAKLSAQTDALVSALRYARSTALSQAMQVEVCPISTANATNCGTDWSQGWIVVSLPTLTASTLLQSKALISSDPILSSTAASVTFDAHGIATTQSHFKLCDSRGGQYAQSVEVIPTGFVQRGDTAGFAVWDSTALNCP